MPKTSRHYSPSLDASSSSGVTGRLRPTIYDHKDEFIERISPVATAIIFFGTFSLSPQNPSLSQQALYKLSFAYRNFLQHAGLKVAVHDETAVLSGKLTSPRLFALAEILGHQIDGIRSVKDETEASSSSIRTEKEAALESLQLLFATDQTLRHGIQVELREGRLVLEGQASSPAQKLWAEQLAGVVAGDVESRLAASTVTPAPMLKSSEAPQVDDESLQALVLFRLRQIRETAGAAIKVKASRGAVALQGKVASEPLRQRVENIARSTLGVRELRSSLSIAG